MLFQPGPLQCIPGGIPSPSSSSRECPFTLWNRFASSSLSLSSILLIEAFSVPFFSEVCRYPVGVAHYGVLP